MINIDARGLLEWWHGAHAVEWAAAGVSAVFRKTEPYDLDKALVALSAPSHVASITLWGNGMVEFIVLDVGTKETVISEDVECNSEAEVTTTLDRCRDAFARMTRP